MFFRNVVVEKFTGNTLCQAVLLLVKESYKKIINVKDVKSQ